MIRSGLLPFIALGGLPIRQTGLPGYGPGGSAAGPRDGLASAARSLELALVELDPLLFRRSGMGDAEVADVHEAVGLIVEGLAVLSRADRRLAHGGSGRRFGARSWPATLVA